MKTIESKYFYIFVFQLHRNLWKLSENKNKAIELTVNQRVAGSSPAGGAGKSATYTICEWLFYFTTNILTNNVNLLNY